MGDFFSSLAQSFESTFITDGRWLQLLKGLWVTIQITLVAAVIGLVLGAVYLRSHDMFSVFLLHFLIDFSNRFFTGSTGTTPVMIIAFVVVLLIEAVYAFTLVNGRTKN